MTQRLTPDEMYGVAKHRAVTLALMLSEMATDERIAPEHRQRFTEALCLIDDALVILRDVPFCEAQNEKT